MYLAQFKISGASGQPTELPVPSGIPGALSSGATNLGGNLIQTGINILFGVAIVLAAIFAVWAGIQWISSRGDPGRVAAARAKLTYAVIGLVVTAGAFFIVRVVLTLFTQNPSSFPVGN